MSKIIAGVTVDGRPVMYADETGEFRITRPGKYQMRDGEIVDITFNEGVSEREGCIWTENSYVYKSNGFFLYWKENPEPHFKDIISGPLDEPAESAGLHGVIIMWPGENIPRFFGNDALARPSAERGAIVISLASLTTANLVRREEQGETGIPVSEQSALNTPSSNGRTPDFESGNAGSTPAGVSTPAPRLTLPEMPHLAGLAAKHEFIPSTSKHGTAIAVSPTMAFTEIKGAIDAIAARLNWAAKE